MLIVHVHVKVKPEHVDAFVAATLANAKASLEEPGVLRFDVIREEGAGDRFVLVEVYRTDDDPARHKEQGRQDRQRRQGQDHLQPAHHPRMPVGARHFRRHPPAGSRAHAGCQSGSGRAERSPEGR